MTTLHDRVCSLLMCVCVSSIYFVFVFICRMTDLNNSVLLPQPFLRLSCHASPTKAELAHLIILLSLSSLHCYKLPMLLLPASFFAFYVCNTLCLYLRMLVFVFFYFESSSDLNFDISPVGKRQQASKCHIFLITPIL